MAWKEKIVGSSGALSSTASVLGSYQVCHSVCLGIIALLSFIGITVAGMPLMFLTKVAVPFWIVGVGLFSIMLFLVHFKNMKFSPKLLMANAGLLVAGIPFQSLSSFQQLFWMLGGTVVAGSILWTVAGRKR